MTTQSHSDKVPQSLHFSPRHTPLKLPPGLDFLNRKTGTISVASAVQRNLLQPKKRGHCPLISLVHKCSRFTGMPTCYSIFIDKMSGKKKLECGGGMRICLICMSAHTQQHLLFWHALQLCAEMRDGWVTPRRRRQRGGSEEQRSDHWDVITYSSSLVLEC